MAFNHYAKIKLLLQREAPGWYIKRINQPTSAKTFKGEARHYDHYYRIYSHDHTPIKYCKFQQLDRLSQALKISAENLPIVNDGQENLHPAS